MGEFKKGDFVRVKDNRGAPMDYKNGDVCQISAVRDDLVFSNKKPGMFAKRFEPWQPRVGERVRYGGRSTVYSEKELIGIEGQVTGLDGNLVTVKWDKAIVDGIMTGGAKYIENIEPIITAATPEQPATIKIEAGKFYKTRDGRKAGPMRVWRLGGWASEGEFSTGLWLSNGQPKYSMAKDSPALIAEWIDEPVVASNDNAQPKLKVGDRVRVMKTGFVSGGSGHSAKIGDEFVLREMNPSKAFWRTNGPDFYEHEIELVVFASIVALIENGQPKPSSTPHVHASTGAAEKEAKRLAAKFKGKKFGVFTLTTTHEEAAPVYDHKWQNLAVLGLKIDAIKELRSITGMGLKPAKDAVEYFLDAA